MVIRNIWLNKIFAAWKYRSIVWLSGVRRVGKTTLSQMFNHSLYLNCDLPSTARKLEDPEVFYDEFKKDTIIIFDEIHQLNNPSQILKIAADEYQHLKILATGSSTLEATEKFKDSLTGRKTQIYLSPILWNECKKQFNIYDFDRRLFQGGLPEALLAENKNDTFYAEWMDSFYARDIQELFKIRNRQGYLQLLQILFHNSGNLIEYTKLSKICGIARTTVLSYLESMRIAQAVYFIRPFQGGGKREIIRRQKCYTFDTGFVAYANGWTDIRENDRGILWEHLVLDMLRNNFIANNIYFWRDKSGREIDFIIKKDNINVDTYECKINPDKFSTNHLIKFREIYPNGKNYCICPHIKKPYKIHRDGLLIEFISDINP